MFCFANHGYSPWLKNPVDSFPYFRCHSFLNLQSARKHFNYAGQLAQSYYFAVRNISNLALSVERKHMVLAKTEEIDIFNNHHLIISLIENSAVKNCIDIFGVTFS